MAFLNERNMWWVIARKVILLKARSATTSLASLEDIDASSIHTGGILVGALPERIGCDPPSNDAWTSSMQIEYQSRRRISVSNVEFRLFVALSPRFCPSRTATAIKARTKCGPQQVLSPTWEMLGILNREQIKETRQIQHERLQNIWVGRRKRCGSRK